MSRDKQIEEMAKLLHGYCKAPCPNDGCDHCIAYDKAKALYNAGYRKASEIAWEIFDKIDEIAYHYLNNVNYSGGDMIYDLNELKKKYTEGGE